MKLPVSFFILLLPVFLTMSQLSLNNRPIENSAEAIQMIDSFIQNVPSLPRYVEGGYSPLGRSPVVDVLLADPLYMPTYAEIVTDLIKNNSEYNRLFPLATALQTASGIPIAQINQEEIHQAPQ